jgi:hypothetical protein
MGQKLPATAIEPTPGTKDQATLDAPSSATLGAVK